MQVQSLFTAMRRMLLAAATAACVAVSGTAVSAEPLKVAAIYTVPVEQQWVGRIHKALNAAQERGDIEYQYSENVANTDYERVMREYAEQDLDLIVGESFAVRARRAKGGGRLSRCRNVDGLFVWRS